MKPSVLILTFVMLSFGNALAQWTCETATPIEIPRGGSFRETTATPVWYSFNIGAPGVVYASAWSYIPDLPWPPYCRAVVSAYSECGGPMITSGWDSSFRYAYAAVYVATTPQDYYLKVQGHCGSLLLAHVDIRVHHYQFEIDIKPGDPANRINPGNWGRIQVALLGADYLDVTEVDVTTLRFGPDEASPAYALPQSLAFTRHLQDVNHDGILDLISEYRLQDTGIACDDDEASLRGSLLSGEPFLGSDSVWPVGCGTDRDKMSGSRRLIQRTRPIDSLPRE